MNRITLQPNVQFLYEEQLARVEMAALGASTGNAIRMTLGRLSGR